MKSKYITYMLLSILIVILGVSSLAQDDIATGKSILPVPTGPYQIGRTSRYWVDEFREEIFSEEPDDYREIMVRLWYPADVEASAEYGAYFPEIEALMSAFEGEETSDDMVVTNALVRIFQMPTNAVDDAPLSSEQMQYPLLIFSPGYGAIPEWYTIQMEELASHGYIVAGINHPYHSFATVFPDGPKLTVGFQSIMGGVDDSILNQVAGVSAEDIVFVIDQLEILNADDPEGMFTGKIDLDRIGCFGMSLGGSAAIIAGAADNRILAIINEDGGRRSNDLLEQPFMFMAQQVCHVPTVGPNYCLYSNDFRHFDFTDWPIYPGVAAFLPQFIGPIDGIRTVTIVRAYVLAFFDKYLKGEDSGLLDGPSDDYPEIEIELSDVD